MASHLKSFWADEQGTTAVEYAVIGIIIGVGLIVSLTGIKTALMGFFGDVADKL
mgnify:CR=1 FL=1